MADTPKTINTLPNEILAMIIEWVFLEQCDTELTSLEDLSKLTLFPYSIAAVCRAWRALVDSVPGYSRKILLNVDATISLEDLSKKLGFAAGYAIGFYVVRENYDVEEDPEEKTIVQDLMQTLLPHIARCRVIVFDLLHTSSLPRITDFQGNATRLRTLKMKSRKSGTSSNDMMSYTLVPLNQPKIFASRNLQYLELDGHVFIEAMRIPGWDASIRNLYQKHLTIYNLTDENQHPEWRFDLRDLLCSLEKLGHLTSLSLQNVDLDSSSCLGHALISIYIQYFHLKGLKRNFVMAFFANHFAKVEITKLTLENCELGEVRYLFTWGLSLVNIASEEDIVAFVREWDGMRLYLRSCPGLDDSLINLLSEFKKPELERFYVPTLRELHIKSCGPVSTQAVKNLVFIREIESDISDLDRSGHPMHAIYVEDTTVPMATEDKARLSSSLDHFTWFTRPLVSTPPVTDSPVLEWDCSLLDLSEIEKLDLQTPIHTQATSTATPECIPDSPIIENDYSLIDWSFEDLLNLP